MTSYSNTCEGTATTAVSTSNSAGPDQFSTVTTTGAGTTCTYTSAHALQGSTAITFHLATVASVSYGVWVGTTSTAGYFRGYIYLTAYPSVQTSIARFYSGTSGRGGIALTAIGTLRLTDSTNANAATTPAAVPLNQFVRVECDLTGLSGTTGNGVARFFSGSNLNSNTPDTNGTASASGLSTGGASLDTIRLGSATTVTHTTAWDLTVDQVAYSDTAQPGPSGGTSGTSATVSVPTATFSFSGAANDAVDAETVVTGGGPMAVAVAFRPPTVNGAGGVGIAIPTATIAVAARAATPSAVMTPAFTATADATNSPPRVLLTVSVALGTQVTIRRVDAQGNSATVRAANPATLVSGGWVGYDYEAPYNDEVTYTATTDASTASSLSTTVTLTVAQPWLVHPGIPDLSVPLEVAEMPSPTRPSGRGLYSVIGRAEAVARSDGKRKARSFDLSVRTYTAEAEDALNTLLDDDSVLLLQIAEPRIYRPLYAWVSIGDLAGAPLATYAEGFYTWTLPCVEAARPAGLLQSQRTWADVVAENATWADVVAGFGTWRDLITDTASA